MLIASCEFLSSFWGFLKKFKSFLCGSESYPMHAHWASSYRVGVGVRMNSRTWCADDPYPNTASHPVLSWPYRHLRTLRPMSSALTKRIVLTAEARDRPYELRDAQVRGLILRVQPTGHKAWIVTWAHGKRRTLGSVEHLSLDQARDQARQAVAEYVQSGLPTLANLNLGR